MTEYIAGQGNLKIGDAMLGIAFRVPVGKCSPQAILPDVQRFADQVTAYSEAKVAMEGRKISCAKGCGACCRQAVPVSPTEARHLAALVEAMPAARAAAVRTRFEEARKKLAATGLEPPQHPDDEKLAYREYGLAYFQAGVPCPFLERESCSIYADRPLVCREYLVTSPPAACAELKNAQVQQVGVPVRVWTKFGKSVSSDGNLEWMPLIHALAFADEHPEPIPDQTGPQRVEAFLKEIQQ